MAKSVADIIGAFPSSDNRKTGCSNQPAPPGMTARKGTDFSGNPKKVADCAAREKPGRGFCDIAIEILARIPVLQICEEGGAGPPGATARGHQVVCLRMAMRKRSAALQRLRIPRTSDFPPDIHNGIRYRLFRPHSEDQEIF